MNWDAFRQGVDTNSVDDLNDYIKELRGARAHVTQAIEHLQDEDAEIDIEIQRTFQRIKKLKEVAA
jgi:membrane protein implicated in regulation of membrane protease activity